MRVPVRHHQLYAKGKASGQRPCLLRFSDIAREWHSRWAYPRLITATDASFLERFESAFGDCLTTVCGEVPGTDYPVAATCTAKETALDRNTHDQLLSAEEVATIAAVVASCRSLDGYSYPRETLDQAYRNAFYYDLHRWGMAHVADPAQDGCWSEKSGFAYRAAALTHDVLTKALNRIVDQLALPDEGYHLVGFNPLSWKRTDLVRAPAKAPALCARPMHWLTQSREAGHLL